MLGPRASAESIAALEHELGLDKPIYTQYYVYLKRVLKGDLGSSLYTRRAVLTDLRDYLPATVELTTASFLIALVVGIPLGIVSALWRASWIEYLVRIVSLLGMSTPIFWTGIMALLVFFRYLGMFPGGGRLSQLLAPASHVTGLYVVDSILTGNLSALGSTFYYLALPSGCLAFAIMGTFSRISASSLLEVLEQDYIRTALAYGFHPRVIMVKYALKNALIPVLTVTGVLYGQLLAGAVLTETIFSWPGVGRYVVRAILNLDFQAVMGFTLVAAVIYNLINLIVDLAYGVVDPRLRKG